MKHDLADEGLTTRPSFMEGTLDDEIAIIPSRIELGASPTAEPEENTQDAQEHEPVTHRISGLPPSKLESVSATESLELLQTKMLDKKFSQIGSGVTTCHSPVRLTKSTTAFAKTSLPRTSAVTSVAHWPSIPLNARPGDRSGRPVVVDCQRLAAIMPNTCTNTTCAA